jgi:hypothetical protein
MANSDKDILITPHKGTANIPEISFVGQDNAPIKLRVLDDNTLSFEGNSGQLFSIDDNLTSGIIFAVSDVSGVPSIQVDANGRIDIARYGGSLNIGDNDNTTDRVLCVTGEIALTTTDSTPAGLCFWESGINTGTAPAQIYWDGPGYNDNENYLSLRTNSTDRLTATFGGGIGINTNNPAKRLHLFGGHGDTSMRLTLPSGSNGGGTGEINMQLWVSEPGRTWDGGGIGLNVTNYYTTSFPSSQSDVSNSYFPRLNTGVGQAYIRFLPNGGRIEFSTMDNDGTTYREQIHMRKGGLGVGTTSGVGDTYRLVVSGDINFTGDLYQNGTVFETLPSQSNPDTRGAILRSDGENAYWDNQSLDRYSGGYVLRGYTLAGYKNSTSWKNVNRTDHASDTTYDLGDQISTSDAYTAGSSNGTYAYVFHSGDNWNINGNAINRFNMLTDTNANISTTMANSMNRTSVMRSKFLYAYTFGNGEPNKFNHQTETATLTGWANGDGGGSLHGSNPACGYGELRGWHNVSNRGSWVDFATESRNSWISTGTDGSNKTISSYTGFMYWNTGGGYRTTNNMSKRYDYSGGQVTTIGKFNGATSGEESYHTGELKGYMVGMYDGGQNNTGAIMDYQTNSYYTRSSLNSKGPAGRASAAGVEYGRGQ